MNSSKRNYSRLVITFLLILVLLIFLDAVVYLDWLEQYSTVIYLTLFVLIAILLILDKRKLE